MKKSNLFGLHPKTTIFVIVLFLFSNPANLTAQNVGIGTTTPIQKLHVFGGNQTITQVESNATNPTDVGYRIVTPTSRWDMMTNRWGAGTNTFSIGLGDGLASNFLSILNTGSVGIGTTTPQAGLHLINNNGFIAQGSFGSGASLPVSGAGTRLMWYPKKAAFRSGFVDGTQWNDSLIGDYSIAMGIGTIASGAQSTALGFNTTASRPQATAMGFGSKATNILATAMGNQTTASGNAATAMGQFTTASGDQSTAMGNGCIASGIFSTAMGSGSIASGRTTFAVGFVTKALGHNSTAMGINSTASGDQSTAIGDGVQTFSYAETAIGSFNTTYTPNGTATDRLFVIGNGTPTAPSDAMIMLKNGNTGIGRNPATNKLEVNGEASKATAGSWVGNSDARLKKNIQPLSAEATLQKLLTLQGVTYEWNDDKTGTIRPEGIQYGFTAQNIQAVFPTLVKNDALGYLQTAYGTYDAMTVEAMRALNDKITEQQKEIATLKSQLTALEGMKAQLAKIEAAVNTKSNESSASLVKTDK